MITTLDKICALGGGAGFPDKYQGAKEGDYPFIKVSDMNLVGNERCITHANNYLDEADRQALGAKVFGKGATVFAKVGAALNLNRRRMLVGETLIDNNMMAAMPIVERVLPEYLFYCLSRIDLGQISQVGSVPSVNQEQVGSLRVFCPEEIKEQQKIVEILSDCDTAISDLQSLILHKKRLFEGLPHQFSRSLNSIEVCSLENISNVTMGQSPPASSYNDVGTGLPLAGGGDDIKDGFVNPTRYTSQPSKTAPKGSILMTVRAPVGDIAISGADLCIGRGFCAIEPKTEMSRDYIRYSLIAMKEKWKTVQQGSTFTAVDKASVLKFSLPFPTDEGDLRRAVVVLQTAQSELHKMETQLDLLKQQKRGLMQQLLTGKLRVKGAA